MKDNRFSTFKDSSYNKKHNFYKDFIKCIFKDKVFLLSSLCLISLFIFGLFYSIFASSEKHLAVDISKEFLKPSISHLFGTNEFGQDMFYLVITGMFNTLCFAISIALVNILIGIIIGVLWGNSKKSDFFMIFIKGILDNIPMIFIYMIFIFYLGNSYKSLFLIIVLFGWVNIACIIRNNLIIIRNKDYNIYSKLNKTSLLKRSLYNYIPSLFPVIFNYFALSVPQTISIEVTISYLSFPIGESHSSLGKLLYSSIYANNCTAYPYLLIFPLIFLIIINLCVYLIGKSFSKHSVIGGDKKC